MRWLACLPVAQKATQSRVFSCNVLCISWCLIAIAIAGGQPALHKCCEIRAHTDYDVQIALEVCGLVLYSVTLMLMLVGSNRINEKGTRYFCILHIVFQLTWGTWDFVFFCAFSAGPREADASLDAACLAECLQGDTSTWRACEDARWPFPTHYTNASHGKSKTYVAGSCELPPAPVTEALILLMSRILLNLYIGAVLCSYWRQKCQEKSQDETVFSSAVVLRGVEIPSHSSGHASERRQIEEGGLGPLVLVAEVAAGPTGALLGHLSLAEDYACVRGTVGSMPSLAEAAADDADEVGLPTARGGRRIARWSGWEDLPGRSQGGPVDTGGGPCVAGVEGRAGGECGQVKPGLAAVMVTGRAGEASGGWRRSQDGAQEVVGTAPDEREILRVLSLPGALCERDVGVKTNHVEQRSGGEV